MTSMSPKTFTSTPDQRRSYSGGLLATAATCALEQLTNHATIQVQLDHKNANLRTTDESMPQVTSVAHFVAEVAQTDWPLCR